MLGKIESYDAEQQTGVIISDKQLLNFNSDSWLPEVPPEAGDDVSFTVNEDNFAVDVNLVAAYFEPPKAVKYKYVAAALGLVFGFAGLHRLYLGYYKIALAQLALTALTQGYGVLWGFIETVLIVGGQINKDAKGRPLK